MAHWAIALACGPHINLTVVPPPAAKLAWKELQLAQQNAEHASPVERDLIEALSHRYADPQPQDRAPLDQAYADAMRTVWQKYPKDPDVGVLFAEAMMDLHPWNQWTLQGDPTAGTDEIVATLDAVLKLNPRQPFANHLYIHANEASLHPERPTAAANRLRNLQPSDTETREACATRKSAAETAAPTQQLVRLRSKSFWRKARSFFLSSDQCRHRQ
jgi:hypothetical protein